MKLVGSRGQIVRDFMYDASGTITTGGTAQLILPERKTTSLILLQNISDTAMYVEFGSARATATLTSGVVTSISVTNGGFGFTKPPIVQFLGGGAGNGGPSLGCGEPSYPSPANPAKGTAVLVAGAVSSITIDNGGSGYKIAPYVLITNSVDDPFGCATPSATSGYELTASGGPLQLNGTACTTDPIAIFCATTGKAFLAKWMS
jgi:hypothetical protein